MNRELTAGKPNEKWVTDITHMTYGLGNKAYLSAIKDLYDGSVVAYQLGRYNDNPLVMNTLKEAIEASPDATPLKFTAIVVHNTHQRNIVILRRKLE